MNRRMLFFCAMIAFALWITCMTVPGALAQDPNRLSNLLVAVWPEYDQPSVLVLIDGTLADSTNLPRQVSVLIPKTARLQVTTWTNADGTFAPEQPSQSSDAGDGYTRITFNTNAPQYHIEYYDDLLRGSPDKTMTFVFKAAVAADQVSVTVQQPLKATNFTTDPPARSTRNNTDGFKYSDLQFPALAPAQTITTLVKYTKADLIPSILPVSPTPMSVIVAPAPVSPWNNVFILAVIVVVGLVAVIGFFLFQRSREPVTVSASTRNRSRRSADRGSAANSVAAFCTQCGYGLASSDVFCPKCGTKRRMV
ncbi:MAG TPA: zinc ribbon domain-containing protein [Anaerolineae bacterium]